MEVQIAVAKVNKYASSESGDTLETIERPNGGLSVVLADGQTSGRGAKAISMMVVRKVIGLLAEGVRDGAAARAASDALYTEKKGKVISTLNIASVDLHSGTIVLTRNNPCPIFITRGNQTDCLSGESVPLGTSARCPPDHHRDRNRIGADHCHLYRRLELTQASGEASRWMFASHRILLEEQEPMPQELADDLLAYAVKLDEGAAGRRYQCTRPQGCSAQRRRSPPYDRAASHRMNEKEEPDSKIPDRRCRTMRLW